MNVQIKPNIPLYLALADPKGCYDFEREVGTYQATDGRTLELPERAVCALNVLEAQPGEEIQITKIWSGKAGERPEWSICLSVKSEQARASAGEPDTLMQQLEASIEAQEGKRPAVEPPTPIRRPAKSAPAPSEQPKLFDRGTGTHGPALRPAIDPMPDARMSLPIPAAPPTRRTPPAVIPWNIAFREVSAWVSKELQQNNLQWSDEAQQAMVCTVLIAEAKAGRVGPWERPQ